MLFRSGELAALAGATLSRISRCWDRKQSFATFDLLRRWEEVSELLGGEPTPPVRPTLWAPRGSERSAGVPDDNADLVPEAGWGGSEQRLRERIVDRILADLDAA